MSAWRLAESLKVLITQINTAYPTRNKASDGTIGDRAHAFTVSDHNPNSAGVVTAFDMTHDPSVGLDIASFSAKLVASRDPRIKYLIRNGQILIPANGWFWVAYNGSNPHTSHLHISVGGNYDNKALWQIGATMNENGVRFGYLAVTGGIQPKAVDVKYWTGRDPEEFTKNLYGQSDFYIVPLRAENTALKALLEAKPKEVIVEVIKEVQVPVEVIKEVTVEKIVEVVKGDDERSLGDLLSAAFKKLFKIK